MSDILLDVEDLRVSYPTERGPAEALDGVSLSIRRGEVVGLVGESGCGKTTLARAILGILGPGAATGRIRFEGRDILALPPDQVRRELRGRAITFVPQDPFESLHPLFKVGRQMEALMDWKAPDRAPASRLVERLALFRRLGRRRKAAYREAILRGLREVQIPNPEQALEKLPGQMSGGQRQRLTIAMALLPQPKLILADEPTTALDVTIQAQVLKLLYGMVREKGVSLLFTTHDLGVASEICDRIVVMYAGQEVELAPTRSFFAAPRHPYTARLLQSLPNDKGEVSGIPGGIPPLVNPPGGCRFHPRCERASDLCRTVKPPPVELAPGHVVRCHHPLSVAA
jgi:peptide/nickel transport system ATP-binding protein